MSRIFRSILLLTALLPSLAEGTWGVSSAAPESRIWGVSASPDTPTREIGSQLPEMQWETSPCGDECATDVGVYVNQNPWTKFDPLGLEKNKEKKKQQPLTKFAKTTERDRRELNAGDVFGIDSDVPRNNKDLSKQTDGINGAAPDASANYWNNDLQNVGEGGLRSVRDVANGLFDIGSAFSMVGTVVQVGKALAKGGLRKLLGETAKEVAEEGAENAGKGGTRWKPGESPHAPTRAGNSPSDSTVRRREWKNEANQPTRGDYTPQDMGRMEGGSPPQRYNPDKGGVESMERSHEPIPKRDGGTQTLPRWPQEHAEVDPYRRPGY